MKISKKKLVYSISILILLLYAFTTGINGLFFRKGTIVMLLMAGTIVLLASYGFNSRKNTLVNVLSVIMLLVVCFNNNANLRNGDIASVLVFAAAIAYFNFTQNTEITHGLIVKYLLGFGIFFAICTIAFKYMPVFYLSKIVPIFDSSYQAALVRQYNNGWMAGFSFHYSSNAIYLVCGFSVMSAALLNFRLIPNKYKKSLIIVWLMTLFALFLTAKRSHIIFSLFILFVSYLVLNREKKTKTWIKACFLVLVAIVVFNIAAEYVPDIRNFIERFAIAADEGDITKGRLTQSAYAIKLFLQNPVFGIGWDAFKYTYNSVFGIFLNVHCVYVQLLCETGILGALVFYSFFVICLIHTVKTNIHVAKFSKNLTAINKIALTYAMFMQMFFCLYCLTGNPLYDPHMFFPYFFACAIGEHYWLNINRYYRGAIN